MNNIILVNLIKAIENKEFDKFLKGEDQYSVKLDHFVPADVPTDWTELMRDGIYKYYKENQNSKIKELFEDTLISMINDNLGLYSAVNIIFFQLAREQENRSPFKINREKVLSILKKQLLNKKEELTNDFRWGGKGKKDGLWGDILRLCKILDEDYGIKLL